MRGQEDSEGGWGSAAPRASRAPGGIVIALFLVLQLVLPLSYYLSRDPNDERFAWRMFSSIALRNCVLSVEESTLLAGVAGTRVLDLSTAVQSRWIGVLEANHARTVRKFLEMRCEFPEVTAVRLERSCFEANGSRVPPVQHSLDCLSGVFGRTS